MTTRTLAIFANDTKNETLQEVKERLNECLTNIYYFDNYNVLRLLTSVRALTKQLTKMFNSTNSTNSSVSVVTTLFSSSFNAKAVTAKTFMIKTKTNVTHNTLKRNTFFITTSCFNNKI